MIRCSPKSWSTQVTVMRPWRNLAKALDETRLSGFETNLRYLRGICRWQPFVDGGVAMRDMAGYAYQPHTIDVLSGGTMTTVQDFPGRVGYWEVGVPPSGPFDSLSFRIANTLVGNPEGAPALEITVAGPRCVSIRQRPSPSPARPFSACSMETPSRATKHTPSNPATS
jgi:hypothetical protein